MEINPIDYLKTRGIHDKISRETNIATIANLMEDYAVVKHYEQVKNIEVMPCCTELKTRKQKLPFMDWLEIETLYDENGFYIYRKELWNIEELEKIHYAEYLSS